MKPPPAQAHVNRLIALSLLLLVFSGTLGLGAVWVRQEISQTANRSRALVGKISEIERRIDEVNAEIAAAVNPDALLKQNQAMRLGLASPREIQVVRIDGSPELRLAAKRNREIFSLASAPDGDSAPVFRIVSASLR
jgi:cell division protein FtsB